MEWSCDYLYLPHIELPLPECLAETNCFLDKSPIAHEIIHNPIIHDEMIQPKPTITPKECDLIEDGLLPYKGSSHTKCTVEKEGDTYHCKVTVLGENLSDSACLWVEEENGREELVTNRIVYGSTCTFYRRLEGRVKVWNGIEVEG